MRTNRWHGTRLPARLLISLVVLAPIVAACDDGGPAEPAPGAPVAMVEVTPTATTVAVRDTARLRATPRAADGSALGGPVVWSSSDTLVATVSADGLVTARAAGIVLIRATSGGRTGTANLTIANRGPTLTLLQPAAVEAGSPTLTLTLRGEEFAPGAQAMWDGQAFPTTVVGPSELRVELPPAALSEPGTIQVRVANPLPGGGVSAALTFTITARPIPVAHVIVTPATWSLWVGGSATLRAVTLASTGGELPGRAVTWSSQDPAIATVDAAGRVTGRTPGIARITATSEGRSGHATVTVRTQPQGTHTYELQGLVTWRVPYIDIGPTTWTDANGTVHLAFDVVTGGTLTLRPAGGATPTWEQTVRVETFLAGGTAGGPVAVTTRTDGGELLIDFLGGSWVLKSTRTAGLEIRTQFGQPGELILGQTLGRVDGGWVWVLR